MKKLMLMWMMAVLAAGAWDVEHDVVAQLTGEFLPAEVKRALDFNDFAILMANCHFPDMTEWPCENGKRRFHNLDELRAGAGAETARDFAALGFHASNWFHTPKGHAALMGALARSFAKGEHAEAAFLISTLTHSISDESALNHPPLLGFFRYSNLPGIDFSMRKVEESAKNVFGFRSDGHVVHLMRERMKDFKPHIKSGAFADAVMELTVEVAVKQSALSGELEGKIAFAAQPEAEAALAELVTMQVMTLENIVATCWAHRSPAAALPGADFERVFAERASEMVKELDPSRQAVFTGVFDETLNPPSAKIMVGVVCEAYSRATSQLSYPGRILAAAAARTLRANGYAVKGIGYWDAAKALPDPARVPVVLVCIGGTGYMSRGPNAGFAAAARAYREKGGRMIVVGGEDVKDVSGLAAAMAKRMNVEVPASSLWHKGEAGNALAMSLVATKNMRRLAGSRSRLLRDPNFDGFCKPVCRMEVKTGEPLLELDNGSAKFTVAAVKDGVAWLPEYALLPYLFVKDDPRLPLNALPLDDFGSKVLLDALERLF